MAIAPPLDENDGTPDEFVEALNGLAVGIVSLDFARRSLAAATHRGDRAAAAAQSLIADAYQAGRISVEDYEVLIGELGQGLSEDEPTEWSEEIVSEAAPTSDTVRRHAGEHDAAAGHGASGALFPGAVLRERFVLQSRLDASGMSEVYKALDRRRQEAGVENPWVAIKLVNPATRRYPEALRLLQQEAALAQRLDHPHIVRVHDFDRDGDHAFITMEWLEGESLGDLLTRQRHRPMTSAHARQVLAEIGDALQFAHSRAITHADVKPGNIFLTRDGCAKLLDFGIARSKAEPGDSPPADARTPAYASCEVLEGQPATPQDDVYSLACVAYRMLAGRRVFGHEDALAAERAGRRPARLRGLNEAQSLALERALAFRRTARTPDVATFLQEFNASPAARPQPAVAPRPASADAARPAPAWLALAAGLALLAVVVTLWRGPDDAAPGTAAEIPPAIASPPPVAETPAAAAALAAPPTMAPSPTPAAPPPATVASAAAPDARPSRPARTQAPPATRGAATAATATPKQARRPAEPVATPAPAGSPPIPADLVAVNGTLLAAAAPPAGAGNATPGPEASVAPAATAGDSAQRPDGAAANTSPAPAGPRQVTLSELSFRRYVEPRDRRGTRAPAPAGWVELGFTVGTDGEPREITITDSSPPGRYEESALAAVRRWRFEPVIEGGQAVERRTGVRLRFQPE